MPLVTPNKSVYLFAPRTASNWCRTAIGISVCEPKKLACGMPLLAEHAPVVPAECVGNFVFTFVRDPETWLESRWGLGCYEDEFSGRWSADYSEFRSRIDLVEVDKFFRQYTSQADYVGRKESITDDLVEALTLAGEDFNEAKIRNLPPQKNVPNWRKRCT